MVEDFSTVTLFKKWAPELDCHNKPPRGMDFIIAEIMNKLGHFGGNLKLQKISKPSLYST